MGSPRFSPPVILRNFFLFLINLNYYYLLFTTLQLHPVTVKNKTNNVKIVG